MCKWACTVLGANVTKETTELRFWTWGNDHVPHFLIVTDLWTHYQCLFFLKINSCVICFQGIGVKKLSWGSTNTRSLTVVVMYKCLFNYYFQYFFLLLFVKSHHYRDHHIPFHGVKVILYDTTEFLLKGYRLSYFDSWSSLQRKRALQLKSAKTN